MQSKFCPFCKSKLKSWNTTEITNYLCDAIHCMNRDMPRYVVEYINDCNSLSFRKIMLDKFYIWIDYVKKETRVWVLEHCFLLDEVSVPRALYFNIEEPHNLTEKIKTLMLFA